MHLQQRGGCHLAGQSARPYERVQAAQLRAGRQATIVRRVARLGRPDGLVRLLRVLRLAPVAGQGFKVESFNRQQLSPAKVTCMFMMCTMR